MIQIFPVHDKAQLKSFIDFPHDLYKGDPFYVPELFIAQRDLLSRHPFLKHSEIQLFLAMDGKKPVGRIAAILNNNHNRFNDTNEGFFGFLDAVDNIDVFKVLTDAALAWLKEKGVHSVIGPVNPSTNETCGMLVEGFDSAPMIMMTYNRPYYNTYMQQLGFGKKTDLLAYLLQRDDLNDKSMRLMESLKQRLAQKGITIRKGNLKNFRQEVDGLRKVYNEAWDKNLGFVPMTDEEFDYMAKDMKLVLDPDFCLVAEHEGKAIGFVLAMPDINQVQRKVKRGRLLPTGIFKLLFGRKKINAIRIIALGITEPYRKMGIEAVFYGMVMKSGLEKGMQQAEASWILEDNEMMNRGIQHINGKVYKKYRLYEKAL
ncbi:MAG: hypothetical protein QM743_01635 [Chitinophagaceae bacterium]